MSARESWTKRHAQREEAIPGRALALTGPMNAVHRCDRCGAQAYVRVLLRSCHDLLFCAHHYRQHAPALAKVAVEQVGAGQRAQLRHRASLVRLGTQLRNRIHAGGG